MMTILLICVAALVAVLLLGWLFLQGKSQRRRIELRLEALAQRDTMAAPAVRPDGPDALVGDVVPAFDLPTVHGERVSRDTLLATGRPLLLVFAEPRCGPCYEVLPDLGGWQRVYGDQLSIAVISTGDLQVNRAMTSEYGIRPVLLQQAHELVDALELAQEPAAVLVQPNGRISAGPRYGTRAIRQLVADTLGMELPSAPEMDIAVVSAGSPVPLLRRPDLNGSVVDLGRHGRPTLLLFWSPGCSHCQDLLPMLRALEATNYRPEILVVSRGPIGLNQDLGLTSPIVLDDDRTISRIFGVAGTPSAAVIDERGILRFPVTRGAEGVHALLSRIAETSPRAAD